MKFILKHFGKVVNESLLEEGREYFVGRHEECDFVLPKETGLSRKHIKIYQSEETGNWTVESISEWGGLYLEGEEIESVELAQSCSLSLKNYVLEFIKEEDPKEKEEEGEEEEEIEEEPEEEIEEQENPPPAPDLNLQPLPVGPAEETKLMVETGLIHSLYIFIDGEFSDHINLGSEDSWAIGRSEECDISIDYSILTRKHMQISRIKEKFYIKDLASANKTFLNGHELTPHKDTLLRPNDEISVADLKMVFEVRNKNHEKIMNNLPVIGEKDAHEIDNLPEAALPKVVLEEAPLESMGGSSKSSSLRKGVMIAFTFLLVAGLIFYWRHEEEQKRKAALLAEQQKSREKNDTLELFYQEALINLEHQRYQLCIDQLEELHQKSSSGYFKDSQQVLIQCQNALNNQMQKEEYLVQEKLKKETEAKIQKIAEECKKQYAEKKIKTEEDLNRCAAELLGGLDPANADISAIRMEIAEKSNLQLLREQKQAAFRKNIQYKRSLYNKAKKIRDQNKPLKAVSAYNVFLKAARGVSSLKELYTQAESERDEIQNKYDEELSRLYSSCESLIQSNKMKSAYYDCKKILEFRSDDKKAKDYIQQAKTSLRNDLKPLYEKSMLHESFSRIEEAVQLWNEILQRDVTDGHYYKKAAFQVKKYK